MSNLRTIFCFETKHGIKTAIYFLITLLLTFLFFVLFYYPLFLEEEQMLRDLLSQFPPEYLLAFGFDISTLFTLNGLFGFCGFFIFIVVGIFASLQAINIFGREKKNKCMDYLFAKPVSRKTVFWGKFLALHCLNIAVFICYYAVAFACYFIYTDGDFTTYNWLIASVLPLILLISSLSSLLTIKLKRIKNPAGMATAIGFGLYALRSIIALAQNDWLRYISFFDYFDANDIAIKGHLDYVFLSLSIGLVILSNLFCYLFITKMDIQGV